MTRSLASVVLWILIGIAWVAFPTCDGKWRITARFHNDETMWLDQTTSSYQTYVQHQLVNERYLNVICGTLENPVDQLGALRFHNCTRELDPMYESKVLEAWAKGNASVIDWGEIGANVGLNVDAVGATMLHVIIRVLDTNVESAIVKRCIPHLNDAIVLRHNAIADEYEQIAHHDIHLFAIAVCVQWICLVAIMGMRNIVSCFACVATIIIGTVAAFGWTVLLTKYNPLSPLLWFVLLSVGLDDAILRFGMDADVAEYERSLRFSSVFSIGVFAAGWLFSPRTGISEICAFGLVAFATVTITMYVVYPIAVATLKPSSVSNTSLTEGSGKCRLSTSHHSAWFHVIVLGLYAAITVTSCVFVQYVNTTTDLTRMLPENSNVVRFKKRQKMLGGFPISRFEWFTHQSSSADLERWFETRENMVLARLRPARRHDVGDGALLSVNETATTWRHSAVAFVDVVNQVAWKSVADSAKADLEGDLWSREMMYAESSNECAHEIAFTTAAGFVVFGAVAIVHLDLWKTLICVALNLSVCVNFLAWLVLIDTPLDFFAMLCIVIGLNFSIDSTIHIAATDCTLPPPSAEGDPLKVLVVATMHVRKTTTESAFAVAAPALNVTRLKHLERRIHDVTKTFISSLFVLGVLVFATSALLKDFLLIVVGFIIIGWLTGALVLPALLTLRFWPVGTASKRH